MSELNDEQRSRLDALLAELETLSPPELIAEGARLRLPLPIDDRSKKQMRHAYAGGIAAQKLLAYIEALREVEARRLELGLQIHHKLQDAKVWRAMRSLDAARPLVEASHLAGQQEVMFHFFAVSVGRIERFLGIAAKAAGHKIPKEDRQLLASFRKLRDYYEHMENELPGRKSYKAAEHEEERDGVLHMGMGFTMDEEERIVLDGVPVDVSERGVKAVEEVLQRHWDGLREDALALVRKHFEADPSDIPPPEAVDKNPIVAVGGGVERSSLAEGTKNPAGRKEVESRRGVRAISSWVLLESVCSSVLRRPAWSQAPLRVPVCLLPLQRPWLSPDSRRDRH